MGGALIQWYLKYCGQFPAAVFVASWVSHSVVKDGTMRIIQQDPGVIWRMLMTWDATSWIRNPQRAAQKLLGPNAVVTPEELHTRLNSESALVIFQHNPPVWIPPENIQTPSLWLIGDQDALVTIEGIRSSANYFGGDIAIIPKAGHNLMMENNSNQTAERIHDWLVLQEIN
jgi:pimeloyl-ACP methyl ester carboxylesterase